MLRRSSHMVAKHSQHMLGKAMDFFLPDVPIERMREIAMHLQQGGVGYYPTSGSPFVHIDAGSVRSWPRMTREQLARLFPDGKTVHLPADGHPLPGYEEAKAEILAAGGSVAGITAFAEADPVGSGRRKSLWAALFGGADEDEDAAIASSGRTLSRAAASRQPTQVAALASASNTNDAGVHAFIMSQAETSATAQAPAPATTTRSRNVQAGRATEPAAPTEVASTNAPASGLPSFLSALRGRHDRRALNPERPSRRVPLRKARRERPSRCAPTQPMPRRASRARRARSPPSRPCPAPAKSLMDIASLVDIPLPPARPNGIGPVEPQADASAVAQANATEPSLAATLVALDHPLPPARPQVFALASSTALCLRRASERSRHRGWLDRGERLAAAEKAADASATNAAAAVRLRRRNLPPG